MEKNAMSLIVAYKKEDVVYLGTDSRVIINEEKGKVSNNEYKIQKTEDGLLVGIAGDPQMRQVLFAYNEMFTLNKSGRLTKDHIVKKIVPAILTVLLEHDLIPTNKKSFYMLGEIVLAYKGDLYLINSDFATIKLSSCEVFGDSEPCLYAKAIMENTCDSDNVEERIVKSLNIASKHCYMVGSPYVLINTEELEYKVIREID